MNMVRDRGLFYYVKNASTAMQKYGWVMSFLGQGRNKN